MDACEPGVGLHAAEELVVVEASVAVGGAGEAVVVAGVWMVVGGVFVVGFRGEELGDFSEGVGGCGHCGGWRRWRA